MTAVLFLACAAIIVLAGTNLSRYGDVIAAKSGLGRVWIGLVLTASVTSVPELVTGLSSSAVHRAPDVAVGDVAGSCVFNLLLLALIDPLSPPSFATPRFERATWISLGGGVAALALALVALSAPASMPSLGWVGLPSVFLALIYAVTLRFAFKYGREETPSLVRESPLSLRKAAGLYAANALVVVLAAGFLPALAVDLAERTGLGQTFVGSAMVGVVTSLPELAVTVSALRIGAAPLAIGNLLGSNLFDVLILAMDDVAYTSGPLLSVASPLHRIPFATALVMSLFLAGAAAIGTWPRAGRRWSWPSFVLVVLYAAHLVWLYFKSFLASRP